MKYLSIDLEATGLEENCLIIEFAAIPVDASSKEIISELKYETYIQCPNLETLKPDLNEWVIENNSELIHKAHTTGIQLGQFKTELENYLTSKEIKEFFDDEKIVLLGKSLNAIDLPFLNRDLGWDFMRKHFSHRQMDLSSVVYYAIDSKILPKICESGSELMKYFDMGEVAHTALADAINTAELYFKIIEKSK